MGLFDNLFGGGNKPEPAPKKKAAPAPVAAPVAAPAASEEPVIAGISPEIVAAIAASISMMDDTSISAELLAAITAAVVHHSGGAHAVRIKRTSNAWAMSGRQKLMDARQTA